MSELNRPRLVTVKVLASMPNYDWLTEPALRHYIHDAGPRTNSIGESIGGNGLDAAVIRIGRRVLIDLDAFDAWVLSHRKAD